MEINIGKALVKLIESIEQILRYIAPGFVAIFVIMLTSKYYNPFEIWVDPALTLYIVCALAGLIGCIIYGIHTTIMIPIILFFIFLSQGCNPFKEILNEDMERWLRHSEKDLDVKAIQERIDRWASLQHFLYCSGYSMIAVPLFHRYVLNNEFVTSEKHFWFSFILGCLTIISALLAEWRLTLRERKLSKKYDLWKFDIQENPKKIVLWFTNISNHLKGIKFKKLINFIQ